MKTIKSVLFSTLAFVLIAVAAISFSSCEHDSCTALICKDGTCVDGLCQCPVGFEGAECQTTLASTVIGKYGGTIRCNYNATLFPIVPDSVDIVLLAEPNKVGMKIRAGNTVLEDNFFGTVYKTNAGKYIEFETLVSKDNEGNEIARIDANVQFDGNQINVFLRTINVLTQEKQACSFIGKLHIPIEEF